MHIGDGHVNEYAMTPQFDWTIMHWPNADAFQSHLAQHNPAVCAWVHGAVLHHTVVPTAAQWRGYATMQGLRNFYISKGWSAGPHLFIAPDGIWQGTPLHLEGVHAGPCNHDRWGLEITGQYDAAPWPPALAELVAGTLAALFRWRGLAADALNGHRDCNSPKTCPGRAIQLPAVRAELARRLDSTAPAPLSSSATLLGAPRCTQAQALHYLSRHPIGGYTPADLALSILPAYWSTCAAVGIDPCLAVAQMILETGNLTSWWAQRPRRNPAGIGVTGVTSASRPIGGSWAQDGPTWREGVSFADWANAAVPAHVGRLVAYATAPGARTPAQRDLVRLAMTVRPLANALHGAAPTLAGLDGRWAVGVGYGLKIAQIAEDVRHA